MRAQLSIQERLEIQATKAMLQVRGLTILASGRALTADLKTLDYAFVEGPCGTTRLPPRAIFQVACNTFIPSSSPAIITRSSHVIQGVSSVSRGVSKRQIDISAMTDSEERQPFYDEEIPSDLDPKKPLIGFPPKGSPILSDKWIWAVKDVEAKFRSKLWRKTFKNKGAVKAKDAQILS